MLNRDLIDITYDFVNNYFAKQKDANASIDFKTICKGTAKEAKISDEEFNDMLGSFYTDLLQDGRFVYLGNDKWNLKERIPLDVYKKNQNSLYDYDNGLDFAEEYDDEALPSNMKDADQEVYEENENETSRDAYDDEDSLEDDEESEIIRREMTKKSSNNDDDDEN